MTEAEVRGRIAAFADVDCDPVLSPEDIDLIVSSAQIVDRYGVAPDQTAWTPTWNVNYAIAQAWLMKASRLAPRYLFMTGGKMLSRQQYFDHAMKMYYRFLSRSGIMAARLTPETNIIFAGVPNNWNDGL